MEKKEVKIILLAAGVGSRISRFIDGKPKCTVNIGKEEKLINYTFDLLNRKFNNPEVVMVLGYRSELIEEIIEKAVEEKGYNIKYYVNPFFRVTNSLGSLYFAKNELSTNTILMNADVFIEEKGIDKIIDTINSEYPEKGPIMFTDESRIEGADYRFTYSLDDMILRNFGKEISDEETTGEYVGIAYIDKKHIRKFKQNLIHKVKVEEYGQWWEDVLYDYIRKNESNIYLTSLKGCFWAEVDYVEDYNRIINFVKRHPTQ